MLVAGCSGSTAAGHRQGEGCQPNNPSRGRSVRIRETLPRWVFKGIKSLTIPQIISRRGAQTCSRGAPSNLPESPHSKSVSQSPGASGVGTAGEE